MKTLSETKSKSNTPQDSGKFRSICVLFTLALISTGLIYLNSCKKEDPEVEPDLVELNEYINNLSELVQPPESSEQTGQDTIELESDTDDYVCQTTTYSENQGFSTMLFKDNVSQNMYPGGKHPD